MLIRKDVYKMAIPVLTEQLFIMSMGVVNMIIASRIGKEQHRKVNFRLPTTFLFYLSRIIGFLFYQQV